MDVTVVLYVCVFTSTWSGANNYPLRGGKTGNFEGGVRANAFVSGGLVPAARRGTKEDGLIAIEDWYATFCSLAGVDPADTKAKVRDVHLLAGID